MPSLSKIFSLPPEVLLKIMENIDIPTFINFISTHRKFFIPLEQYPNKPLLLLKSIHTGNTDFIVTLFTSGVSVKVLGDAFRGDDFLRLLRLLLGGFGDERRKSAFKKATHLTLQNL